VTFAFCWYLNSVKPLKYVWSALFLLALVPAFWLSFATSGYDPVAILVRAYLCWMCAEVAFQSAAAEPELRIDGWWALPILLLIFL
jgi:hypothetical protein